MNNFFYRCCKKKECIHMIEVGFNLHFMFCSSSWLLLTTISAFVLTFILHSSTDKPPTEESHNLMSGQLADYICLGNYLLCLIMWIPKFQSPTCVETLRFYKMMQAKLCARQKDSSTAYLAMRMEGYWSNHQAMIAEWHLGIGGRCSLYLCSVVTWRMRVCNNNLFSHYILSSEGRKILHEGLV